MAITIKIMKRSSEGRPTLYATRDLAAAEHLLLELVVEHQEHEQ